MGESFWKFVAAIVFLAYPLYWILSNLFTAFLSKSKKIYMREGPFVTPNTEINPNGFKNEKDYRMTFTFQQIFAVGLTLLIIAYFVFS